jgi:hypothetical protein
LKLYIYGYLNRVQSSHVAVTVRLFLAASISRAREARGTAFRWTREKAAAAA